MAKAMAQATAVSSQAPGEPLLVAVGFLIR
jgi:hypothetical protein